VLAPQEAYHEKSYTKEGLAHVEATTFKTLILRHYPELKDSVGDVNNAFYSWTGTPHYQPLSEPSNELHEDL
jgi:hypothetical protein